MKKENGITLIALVITIIVLLILAGVSISLVLGDNGILTKAQKSVKDYGDAEVLEQIKLAYSAYEMAKAGGTTENAKSFVENRLKETLEDNNLIVNISDSTGEIIVSTKVRGESKEFVYDPKTGNAEQLVGWKDNGDGTYTDRETGKMIHVGDIVKYEEKLETVTLTSNSKLITDIATYSGNTDNTKNTVSTISQEKTLKWKVLDVKNGKIRLISSVPTSSKIQIEGYNGFNNVVFLIDEACDCLYSTNGIGKAQNLKIEDIEEKIDKTKFDYTQYFSEVNAGGTDYRAKFGDVLETSRNDNSPAIFPKTISCVSLSGVESNGILDRSEQTELINGTISTPGTVKCINNNWYHSFDGTEFLNPEYYKLFIYNENAINEGYEYKWLVHFLSSRCTKIVYDDDNPEYCVYCTNGGHVGNEYLFASYQNNSWSYYRYDPIRPVITLDSNVKLNGNSTDGWTIE